MKLLDWICRRTTGEPLEQSPVPIQLGEQGKPKEERRKGVSMPRLQVYVMPRADLTTQHVVRCPGTCDNYITFWRLGPSRAQLSRHAGGSSITWACSLSGVEVDITEDAITPLPNCVRCDLPLDEHKGDWPHRRVDQQHFVEDLDSAHEQADAEDFVRWRRLCPVCQKDNVHYDEHLDGWRCYSCQYIVEELGP